MYLTSTGNSTITFSNSYSYNFSSNWAVSVPKYIMTPSGPLFKPKVYKGKYQVRCRGCARWAKIVKEDRFFNGLATYRVNCERCLGENDGFV